MEISEDSGGSWITPKGISTDVHRVREALREAWREEGIYTGLTIFEEVEDAVKRRPDCSLYYRRASDPGAESVLTLSELQKRGMEIASSFKDLGLEPGDVIGIQLPNWPETTIAYYAALALGLVLLPIIDIYASAELSHILEESRAKALIVAQSWRHMDYRERLGDFRSPWLEQLIVIGGEESDDIVTWQSLEAAGLGRSVAPARPNPSDPVLVLYTSGSTSLAKGVVHSHETLLAEQRLSPLAPEVPNSRRYLLCSPPGHVTGFQQALRSILYICDAVVLDSWDVAMAKSAIEDRALTSSGGNFFMQSLLEEFEGSGPLPRMEWSVGGSAVPRQLVDLAESRNWIAARAYGSSEHPTVSGTLWTDPLEVRATTDGRPSRGNEVRILDEDGLDVDSGQDGLVVTRGPELFLGYIQPELNGSAFLSGGWFDTGDLGRIDPGGNLVITGRVKDIIIRGGENISSLEVEEVLWRHVLILDAAVVPYPDKRYGERVAAFVVLQGGSTLTLKELGQFFTGEGFAKQKIPERLVVVDELPRTRAGKVDKQELRRAVKQLIESTERDGVQ